jgi:hypothetical protein
MIVSLIKSFQENVILIFKSLGDFNLIVNDFVSETRPVTHQQSKQKDIPKREDSQDEDKPVLRRERTFDLDPKMSIRQVKLFL